jgi:hypothetical protein
MIREQQGILILNIDLRDFSDTSPNRGLIFTFIIFINFWRDFLIFISWRRLDLFPVKIYTWCPKVIARTTLQYTFLRWVEFCLRVSKCFLNDWLLNFSDYTCVKFDAYLLFNGAELRSSFPAMISSFSRLDNYRPFNNLRLQSIPMKL